MGFVFCPVRPTLVWARTIGDSERCESALGIYLPILLSSKFALLAGFNLAIVPAKVLTGTGGSDGNFVCSSLVGDRYDECLCDFDGPVSFADPWPFAPFDGPAISHYESRRLEGKQTGMGSRRSRGGWA